jgi:hypothetical protein
MKLRIRGNTIRLRVSKSELAQIAADGHAEDRVQFAPHASLRYRVETTSGGAITARFTESLVAVAVPQAAVRRWLEPAEVSIVGEQDLGGGEKLDILVEKDFECLAPRSGEDSADLFVNPAKGARADD